MEAVKTSPRLVVDVSRNFRSQVKIAASARGQTMSEYVLDAIEAYMNPSEVKERVDIVFQDSRAA